MEFRASHILVKDGREFCNACKPVLNLSFEIERRGSWLVWRGKDGCAFRECSTQDVCRCNFKACTHAVRLAHHQENRSQRLKKVTIYTDGACSGNPGPGGWGAILK